MHQSSKPIFQGFNPCKGFGGFGTPILRIDHHFVLRFNPCKGFGGFGTLLPSNLMGVAVSFNPCKGFGGFGTRIKPRVINFQVVVSIPVRVLGVLEQDKHQRLY